MKLHKWLSKCPDVLKHFQESQNKQAQGILSQVVSTDAGSKALGIHLDTSTDVLYFDPTLLLEASE